MQAIIVCNFKENKWTKSEKMTKNLVLGLILAHLFGPNAGCYIFFSSKIWLRQSLDVMVSYQHVQYQKKITIQSWENLVTDGQNDRQPDRLTDSRVIVVS